MMVALLLMAIPLTFGQKSISFLENSLEAALSSAKAEGKDIFLDSYAIWCKPCKKMDKVFRNPKVAQYYNENFINLKINVDDFAGKEIAEQYDIIFLPTMLILDANGFVKQRIDGLMSAEQLLTIGASVVNGNQVAIVETRPRKAKKLSKKVMAESTPVAETGEKILFVLDDPKAQDDPEYLFHEAFFRFQQMDGSHDAIVQKYLATQEDWSTEKNVRFIMNFMDNTDSDMFRYYVTNEEIFTAHIGAEKYRQTLEILINDCLYRKSPRPKKDEVETLFGYLYPRKANKYTYEYLLGRYEAEQDYVSFVTLGEEYLETLLQPDALLLYKLGKYKCANANQKDLKVCVYRVEESIRLSEEVHYDQHLTLAKLYLKQGKERAALEEAEKARIHSLGNTNAQVEVATFLAGLDNS